MGESNPINLTIVCLMLFPMMKSRENDHALSLSKIPVISQHGWYPHQKSLQATSIPNSWSSPFFVPDGWWLSLKPIELPSATYLWDPNHIPSSIDIFAIFFGKWKPLFSHEITALHWNPIAISFASFPYIGWLYHPIKSALNYIGSH